MRSSKTIVAAILLVVIALLGQISVFGEEISQEEIQRLGKEALRHYENNEYEAAIAKFNRLLLANPSNEQLLRIRSQIGHEKMMQMLVRGGEMARVARALFVYAEDKPIRQETSPEVIRDLVERAISGNTFEQNEAISLLRTQVGERAIPYMLPYLADQTLYEKRINTILAITKIGKVVTVPLVESLNSSDPFLRQQVSILLGYLQDRRALPDLKRLLENPREDREVKRYAEEAVKKIARRTARVLPAAEQLYVQKALAYYRSHPAYIPPQPAYLDWRWEQRQLVSQEVPRFAYNEVMAEHACHQAIELNANYRNAWAVLAQVYCAQYMEIEAIEDAKETDDFSLPSEEHGSYVQEKKLAQDIPMLVAAAGPEVLNTALSMSLQEERPFVSVKLLDLLGKQFERRNQLSLPMLRALRDPDKRIRYAAATAIVQTDPPASFKGANFVVEVLAEALQEWDARTVLVIDDNDNSRNAVLGVIRQQNLVAFAANSGARGIQKAKAFPPEDLIIVSSELEDMATSLVVRSLKEDYRTSNIPILVLAPSEKIQQQRIYYEGIAQVKDILQYPIAAEVAKKQIHKHLSQPEGDNKSKSKKVAEQAAQTLASVNIHSPAFDLSLAAKELIASLSGREDSIRLPAITALGKLGQPQAIEPLQKVLFSPEEKLALRTKAAWSLGQIYSNNHKKVRMAPEDVKKVMQVLAEQPQEETQQVEDFRKMVFSLVGKVKIFPEDRRHIFASYRVHKEIGSAQVAEKEERVIFEEKEEETQQQPEKKEEEIWEDTPQEWNEGGDDYLDDIYGEEGSGFSSLEDEVPAEEAPASETPEGNQEAAEDEVFDDFGDFSDYEDYGGDTGGEDFDY